MFSRVSFSPSDRNLINAYIDGGIVFAGFIPQPAEGPVRRGRDPRQVLGQRPRFRSATRWRSRECRSDPRLRNQSRTQLQAQIVPGWIVQPNLQFIWHPNGDAGTETRRSPACVRSGGIDAENKLIPGLESGPILIAPRSIEGVVISGV